jgi:hypothetical protein
MILRFYRRQGNPALIYALEMKVHAIRTTKNAVGDGALNAVDGSRPCLDHGLDTMLQRERSYRIRNFLPGRVKHHTALYLSS